MCEAASQASHITSHVCHASQGVSHASLPNVCKQASRASRTMQAKRVTRARVQAMRAMVSIWKNVK